tara:strand:- start:859 stop:1413 length:555 start_codon:yes stop_codon:yes gene_type:complete
MLKYLILIVIFFFYGPAQSSIKNEIISKLINTKNLSFNFKQNINDEIENGHCIIEYPRKIYCEYNNSEKKIIVSDGKSLLIKNKSSETFYLYPLNRTPLGVILDKDYLIKKINTLEEKNIDNRYINFKMIEENNTINIFFDYKTFNLIGWQTEDIYQNLIITFISSIKINQKINNNLFKLPQNN